MRDDENAQSTSRLRPPVDVPDSEVLQARQDLLTYRDHVIGLEAESASLQQMVDRLLERQKAQKLRLEEVRGKLDRQRNRADRLRRELDALLKTTGTAKPGRRLLSRRDSD